MEYLESDAISSAFVAGFGSGKSFIATLKTIRQKLKYPDHTVAMYFPNYGLVRDIAYDKFPEMLEMMGIDFTLNKSSAEISFPDMSGKIIFRSMDNPALIVGFETSYCVIDEADLLPMSKMEVAYNKILARNRQKLPDGEPNRIDCCSTPEGYKFLYNRFVENFNPETDRLIKASTYSNPHLPDGYIDSLIAQYPEQLIKAYLNGEFVNLNTGAVYPYFDRDIHNKEIKDEVIKSIPAVHIGMDFNVGGCVSVVCVIIDGIPVAVDEVEADDTFRTIDKIKDKYGDKLVFVYPDAAGSARKTSSSTTDIALLREAGFNVRVGSKNPAVKDRINSVNGLLDHNNVYVDVNRCPKLTKALEQQAYTDKGEPEKFDVHPAIDDYNDAFGYFLHKKFGIAKKTARVGKF